MSIQEIDSEKVIRGSNEGFADSIKINTALIRRRLRSTRLKCKEVKRDFEDTAMWTYYM